MLKSSNLIKVKTDQIIIKASLKINCTLIKLQDSSNTQIFGTTWTN